MGTGRSKALFRSWSSDSSEGHKATFQRGDSWELGKEDGCLEQKGQGELHGEEGTARYDCGGEEKKTF